VHFNFTANVSITPDVGQNNLIAMGHSKSYQMLPSLDLQNCIKMGKPSLPKPVSGPYAW